VDGAPADHRQTAPRDGAQRPSVSTIIPVWNEAEAIATAVATTHEFLAAHFDDFEIVIVESGSSDGSVEVCDRLAAQRPRVAVIHEGVARGFGSALRLGYQSATKDLVWVVSADLPFPLDKLLAAVPLLADHDAVLSYRVEDERGLFRRGQSWVYNTLAKTLLGLTVTHVNSTFKVYRRPVIQGLALTSNGWLIDTEIVYRLERAGARLAELPVPLIDRKAGRSTIRPITPFLILRDLLEFAWRERRR
jgi:glycosyltransferase involved in cell wall biosynthesis